MDPDPGNSLLFLLQTGLSWPSLIGQLILFVLLIMVSFMVSGAEVAFFSLTKLEIEQFKNDESKEAQLVWSLISLPKRLLATILITNNLMNVAAILVGSTLIRMLADVFSWVDFTLFEMNIPLVFLLNVVLITSVLLFFGEIIPKVYAARNRHQLVMLLARPLGLLRWFFKPLSAGLIEGTRFIEKHMQLKETGASIEDLKHAIDLTTDDIRDKDEKDILKGIVNFGNIPVKSIMRARVDVKAIELNTPQEEILAYINEHGFSRMPVYEENLDNIKGILHIKDLLLFLKPGSEPLKLSRLLRKSHFVPESKKIDTLLEEFKLERLHMAIVVDEFGGTAGVVTLEDVIEEIFGEINDEFDSEDWVYTKLSEDTYIFEGRIALNDVRRILNLEETTFEDARGDSDTLGGLILELHGKIPSVGDIISYQQFDLHVESVSKTRISMVKLVINRLPEEEKNNS